MSATQARFLCLTARKSNVEFQGQQINQQRTTLSNESANYYSELCNMKVPTPPSVDDYTKVTYTFNDGAMTNTITSMIARSDGNYSISYMKQWQDDYAVVPAASSLVAEDTNGNFIIGATKLRKIEADYATGDPTDDYVAAFMANNADDEYIKTLDADAVKALLKEEAYYAQLLNLNSNSSAKGPDWYVRYVKDQTTGAYKPYFYSASECGDEHNQYGTENFYNVSCFTLGSATQTEQVLNREGTVEKDTSGRYVSIVLYMKDSSGNIITDEQGHPKTEVYPLTTHTITDEDAYNDAMNQYAFEQAQYDKKIQDINAQLEIVQQQDKKLELNLKQLDTEENAINTEMEAVKKVIQKNVESSFKTFNA